MYSSLTGASKLYGGSTSSKSKPKSGVGSVKKRRKKNKLLPQDPDHSASTSTLVESLRSVKVGSNFHSESDVDAVESASDDASTTTVRFCTQVLSKSPIHENKYSDVLPSTGNTLQDAPESPSAASIAIAPTSSEHQDHSDVDSADSNFHKDETTKDNESPEISMNDVEADNMGVIVNSESMDTVVENSGGNLDTDLNDIEGKISGAVLDTDLKIDEYDNIDATFDADSNSEAQSLTGAIIVTSAEVHHNVLDDTISEVINFNEEKSLLDNTILPSSETIVNPENEKQIVHTSEKSSQVELYHPSQGNDTGDNQNSQVPLDLSNSQLPEKDIVTPSQTKKPMNEPFLAPDRARTPLRDLRDNVSVESDCCVSRNIYNEYNTENANESDEVYVGDEDSQNNSPDESLCDDNENAPLVSPEASEVSATESYHCENGKNITTKKNTEKLSMKGDDEFFFDEEQIMVRSKSLPDYIESIESDNLLYSSEMFLKKPFQTVNYASDVEFQKLMNQKVEIGAQQVESRDVNREEFNEGKAGLQKSKSVESSVTSLSTTSSGTGIFPLVTMKEARQKSFVVGNVKASGSLLGVEELSRYFPEKKVNVFVGTWNMNGQDPPESIDDFLLPLRVPYVPDIYAVGVQEASQSRTEWEILMQATIGPSHILLMSASLGVLHLAIFIRRDLIWFCSEPEDAHVTTRPGSMVKTKGAVAISFMFFGTSFLFINSHLTAHEKKVKERVADYEKICNMIDLPKKFPLKAHYQSKDVTSRFDNVFWCGDLNFRVVHNRPSVLRFVEEKLMQTLHTCDFLLQHDQLHRAMSEGVAFHGFREGVINFVPSYKFDIGTCFFNSSKQRIPSYTDRVLYRCKKIESVCCTHYNAVSNIMTSDHKPVFAIFDVTIRPGRDNIPLAAGSFRRDIYLEANKRRAAALEVTANHRNSTICSVM